MATTTAEIFKESIDFLSQHQVFYGHGVELAEDEVLLLLMSVLGKGFAALNAQPESPVSVEQVKQVKAILQKRVDQRIPMAYLVGFSVFAGLRFRVDQRVLIPRSPFVELIDLAFEPWLDMNRVKETLDLCTGSGCIGLAIAHYFTHSKVDVSDISEGALEVARINRQALQLEQRVNVIQSDLFERIGGSYDLIVSNPPYVDKTEYDELPEEFRHEPETALVSNELGMEIPAKILRDAPNHLSEQGWLFLEVGYNDEVLAGLFPEIPFEWIHFSMGGQGICVFKRDDLLKYRPYFDQFLQSNVS